MTNQALASASIKGVNLAGYLTGELGVGVAARGYAEAIKTLSLDIALNNFEGNLQNRANDHTLSGFAQNNPYPINIVCVNADQLEVFVESYGAGYFQNKYNIGVWWWELPEFPQQWWDRFTRFDELWVGSTYVQQSLGKYSPVPVVVIPPVVNAQALDEYDKKYFGLAEDEFVFLFMFDFNSVGERKNPLGLIEAFKKAFTPSQPARLVLKTINGQYHADKRSDMRALAGDARITFMDRYLSAKENRALIQVCDSYASLHRSEGLGLPLAEAMLSRKPVIATAWSGNMDFMTVNNSFLVPYKLVLNPQESGPYKVGEVWAEPDIDAAAERLKEVFSVTPAVKQIAQRGFLDAANHFSRESVAAAIQSRFKSIATFHKSKDCFSAAPPITYNLDSRTQQEVELLEDGAHFKDREYRPSNNVLAWLIWPLRKLVSRLIMPYLNKQAEYNGTAARLIRRILIDPTQSETRIDLLEERMRLSLAQADTRIRELEKEIDELKKRS